MKKIIAYVTLTLLALALPMPAFCQAPPNAANAGTPPGGAPPDSDNEKVQPVPDVAPDIDAIAPSLPGDCKSLDDELARLEKFAKNPKATQKQIAANQTRVTQLKNARTNAQCDNPDADKDDAPAAPATTPPAKK